MTEDAKLEQFAAKQAFENAESCLCTSSKLQQFVRLHAVFPLAILHKTPHARPPNCPCSFVALAVTSWIHRSRKH
jgi:hypothetical protein